MAKTQISLIGKAGMVPIPTRSLSEEQRRAILGELDLKADIADNFGFGVSKVRLYEFDGERFWVPRVYAEEHLGYRANENFPEHRKLRCQYVMKSGISLRDDQIKVMNKTLDHLTRHHGGIVSAKTGWGKTVFGLTLAVETGLWTLIVVHTNVLKRQWEEWIERTLGLRGNEIGAIQGDEVNIQPITIGMIQSLSMKDYNDDIYGQFGLLIFDEVHHLAAEVFVNAVTRFDTDGIIGLSATPDRADGLDKVLHHTIGPVITRVDNWGLTPLVVQHRYPCNLFQEDFRKWNGDLNLGKLITTLANDDERTDFIVQKVAEQVDEGRKVLVLTDRVAHAVQMRAQLSLLGKSPGRDWKVQICTGNNQSTNLEGMRCSNIVVGTFCMAKEGLDLPEFSVLVLATPRVDLVQAVGRILRVVPDKPQPHVVDVIDAMPVLIGFGKARRARFLNAGFEVRAESRRER